MNKLNLQCANWPPDLTWRFIKSHGEGYTWTCPECFQQFVLTQGKGTYWYWKPIKKE